MIDLHCHIVPGLDDGAPELDTSIAMARVAENDGIRVIATTPHIRDDHPFDPKEIAPLTAKLNENLRDVGVELRVVPGGELAISKSSELDDETLRTLCLGGDGGYLLVESPYTHATDLLERDLFNLQLRGFRVILAHPERSPSFIANPGRLAALVERGVMCSV